ncbi:Regulatory cys-3 [Hyphodiscus hymeniophilus]|uniref:Regulatory cys-3 n=1 Tax=Hyphodiscus hymeniophilus TaxID=353542 RepID=A0A9P6SLY4_9HELO|nr:Regulatory cys-3 [Hyphodiscus hymeniophilus]
MTYNSRRPAPNMSDFVNQLNAIPSAEDLHNAENFNIDDDLAMFTNTQFFDFDLGQDANVQADFDARGAAQTTVAPQSIDMKPMDFDLQEEYNFPDFNTFTHAPAPFTHDGLPQPHLPAIQTNQPYTASNPSTVASPANPTPTTATKRKASSPAEENYEDASRNAAEEDKRRRNTAASARFRVKKKQREQALERSAKDMSDKVSALEGRINQLETENKWLKNLITEKNESKEDIAELYRKYSQETAERKAAERKDGVGTKAAKATKA